MNDTVCLNPYSTGSNSNITHKPNLPKGIVCLNPYSTGSNSNKKILNRLTKKQREGLNPYSTGSNSNSQLRC